MQEGYSTKSKVLYISIIFTADLSFLCRKWDPKNNWNLTERLKKNKRTL